MGGVKRQTRLNQGRNTHITWRIDQHGFSNTLKKVWVKELQVRHSQWIALGYTHTHTGWAKNSERPCADNKHLEQGEMGLNSLFQLGKNHFMRLAHFLVQQGIQEQ